MPLSIGQLTQEMGREMESDTQERSSALGFKPATRCQVSELMSYAPGPLVRRAPLSSF